MNDTSENETPVRNLLALIGGAAFAAYYPASVPVAAAVAGVCGAYYAGRWVWKQWNSEASRKALQPTAPVVKVVKPVPLPPPPTREELERQARKRYESTLRALEAAALDEMELQAARAKAKQLYLRELDRLM